MSWKDEIANRMQERIAERHERRVDQLEAAGRRVLKFVHESDAGGIRYTSATDAGKALAELAQLLGPGQ